MLFCHKAPVWHRCVKVVVNIELLTIIESMQFVSNNSYVYRIHKWDDDHVIGRYILNRKGMMIKKTAGIFQPILVWNILHLIGKHYWQGSQQRDLDYTMYWCFCLVRGLGVVIVIWWGPKNRMLGYTTTCIFWGNGKKTETWCVFVWFLGDMLVWQGSILLFLRMVFLKHNYYSHLKTVITCKLS